MDYAERVRGAHLVPLWDVMQGLLPHAPQPETVPQLWRRADWQPALEEAGRLVSTERAERRVLLLENAAFPGRLCIAPTLHAGLQLLLPGETARPHRHSQAALRFVVAGAGAYTAVDGERAAMRTGDFIITPPFAWHEHGNPGTEPVIWLDGLDLPLVRALGTTFAQFSAAAAELPSAPAAPPAGAGEPLAPIAANGARSARSSATFAYPYADARRALERMSVDPRHGAKLYYADPRTGEHAMPSLAAYLQRLPAAFRGTRYRTTETLVYCVAEGEGSTEVEAGDGAPVTLAWSRGDLFVVPAWRAHRHVAATEAVLFSFSDGAAQQRLGLWREAAE